MSAAIDHLAHGHHPGLVLIAGLVCLFGSYLSVMTLRRLHHATGMRLRVQLIVASVMGGVTIWATHFIAMLAYDPGIPHGYDPALTGLSLIVAVAGLFLANCCLAYGRNRRHVLLGGCMFGLTVTAMHYTGMAAYMLPGRIDWQVQTAMASALLGVAFGAATYHRIAIAPQRGLGISGVALMVAAICLMHFTGMAAVTVQLSPLITVPPQILPDATLALIVVCVTLVVLSVGFASLSIEMNLENETLAQLEHVATHDQLTDLPNRVWLIQTIDAHHARSGAAPSLTALTLNLKSFKLINDLHGPAAGDRTLQRVAARLDQMCAPDETVTRAAGDEFVLLKRRAETAEVVEAFAARVHDALEHPFDMGDLSVVVSAAIGIATTRDDITHVPDLLQRSQLAMYRAKTDPDRPFCRFDEEMDTEHRNRLLLIEDLGKALENDEFELVYQLQNDLPTLETAGCEALLRWNHPTRGRVSPAEFIPIAEETGIIRDIGTWVLRTACFEAASWTRPISVAVNVAPQQLVQSRFVSELCDTLAESGLPPHRLELEITEASIIDDHATTLRVMHRIKEMGIHIAMDDFGTGYSSLASLQAFPFDKIKVDRSFIRDVHAEPQRAAIVRAVFLLGQSLNIPVLAEGVETDAELDWLRRENCAAVQGFYFGTPRALADMRALANAAQEDVA